MKAKEYAQRYFDAGKTDDALGDVWRDMVKEVTALCESRKAQTPAAFVAVFEEINQKWKAFARITGVNPSGFSGMIEHKQPDFYRLLKQTGARL